MKRILAFSALFIAAVFTKAGAQTHSLQKIWATDTLLRVPESVLYEAKGRFLYVSNIDGDPAQKDGKGSIGKVGLDGRILTTTWVTGLNAPKGMGIYKGRLYVADLSDVVVIDISKASIIQKIPVPGAVFLNDITIDQKGTVYVSDTRTFKVHRIQNGVVSTLLENLKGPNGLLAVDNDLLILDRGSLIKMLPNGALSNICTGMDPSTDGIEMVKKNEYLVSAWNGVLYYIYADGNKQTLLDSREQKINTADIGYDAVNRILYVPTFLKNNVVAYRLK
jgi:hypothetical protein